MAKAFPSQDVIIEVLDARMPYASSNPVVTALRKQKPCLKLLSKADLADPEVTREWLDYFSQRNDERAKGEPNGATLALAYSSERFSETKKRLQELCLQLSKRTTISPTRPIRAIVVGIPNVGKSTLINLLMGRKVAKVGDEPAVTKSQQQVILPNGLIISDNPGLLWPKFEDKDVGLRLAFGGAISEAALDYEPVARYGAALLIDRYPAFLVTRYKLKHVPPTGDELLLEIGKKRGCLRSGGLVDLHKAADVLIHDFRSGALGKISLEKPGDARPCEVSLDTSANDSTIDDPVSDNEDGNQATADLDFPSPNRH
jgi:ribosome biogenesis GTPase A